MQRYVVRGMWYGFGSPPIQKRTLDGCSHMGAEKQTHVLYKNIAH